MLCESLFVIDSLIDSLNGRSETVDRLIDIDSRFLDVYFRWRPVLSKLYKSFSSN